MPKRNLGIIGAAKSITKAGTASGITELLEVYRYAKEDKWPKQVTYYSLSPGSGTIYENSTTSFTLTTYDLVVNTTLYWTISHGTTTSTDFYSGVVSGSFTQSASTQTGTFSITTSLIGNTAKTAKTFQIQIRTGSTAGPVVFTSFSNFSIPAVGVTGVYWGSTPVNEGSTAYLYFQLYNCGNAYSYALTLTNTGTITGTDIGGTLPTSWYVYPANYSSLSYTFLNDITTEGSETLTVQVSFGGYNLGSAQTLTVNDTSTTPTATVTPSASSGNEGTSVTFTVSVSGSYTGTLYWTTNVVSGTVVAADFTDSTLSGSFTVTSGSGSIVRGFYGDNTAESPTESFTISVRVGSTSGTIIGTSSTVTINDATVTGLWSPSYPITISSSRNTAYATNNAGPSTAQTSAEIAGYFTSSGQTVNGAAWTGAYFQMPASDGYIMMAIPNTGTYRIQASGGPGGYTLSGTYTGDRGALIQADFALTQGDYLWMTIGQSGSAGNTAGNDGAGAGGGGCTVVAKYPVASSPSTTFPGSALTLLLFAAGGLGAAESLRGGTVGTAYSSDGASSGGWTSWYGKTSMTGGSAGWAGMYSYGGWGGGTGTDDGWGGAGSYTGMYTASNTYSYVNPTGTNITRTDGTRTTGGATYPSPGYIVITKL